MSDCESEDYSCSEDEDYVPSGGEYSEDDINDLVKESGDDEDEEGSKKPSDVKSKKKVQKTTQQESKRKESLSLVQRRMGVRMRSRTWPLVKLKTTIFFLN
uniref:Uncharacterized protein n=1 Tax=Xenopus tropicalis TaxID=8364 RepID=B1WB14_XENTR|nr:Unknown (protein for MGC:147646) [Xenopus tropicalis]